MIAFMVAAVLSDQIVRYPNPVGPTAEEGKVRLTLGQLSVNEGHLKFAGQIVNVSKENVPIYRPFPGPLVYVEWFLPSRITAEIPACWIPNLGGAESEFVPPGCGRTFDGGDQLGAVKPGNGEYVAVVNFVYDSRYIHGVFLGEQKNGWVPVPIGVRLINGPYRLSMKGNRVLALLTKRGRYGTSADAGRTIELPEAVNMTHPWTSQGF